MAKLIQEAFLRQKSRATWLEKGDLNTKYFHNFAKARRGTNSITKIQSELGAWLEKQDEIIPEITSFFSNLLGHTDPSMPMIAENALDLLPLQKVKPDVITSLTAIPNPSKIHKAIQSIHGDKSPGPDGYSSKYFQHSWKLTGPLVCEAVQSFFSFMGSS